MATVTPTQTIVAADSSDLAALKSYLDRIGYTVAGESAARVDDDGALTVTITYPSWVL